LKQLCYQGGAEDNLTAIVVDFGARPYFEDATRPRVSAQAAQAQAATEMLGEAPRHANKIEVNLKSHGSDSGKLHAASAGGKQGNAHASQQSGARETARQSVARTESLPGAAQLETRGFKKPKSRASKIPGDETPLKEEMSILMKMSWLFITLIIGVVSGALLYGYTPLKGIVDNLMGKISPYDERQIQYSPRDLETYAAFADHLAGRSDEARKRINAALAAKPDNAEALYYLGRIDLDQKKYDEALNRLKKAGELDPKLPNVWAHLAEAYLGLGQTRNAIDVLQRISAPSPSAPGASPQSSPTPAK
jgi:cytochrome c-type biogenesis protein CcmH/NrfG